MEKHPDLEAVEFLMVDPNGVMRGKWAPADALKKAFEEGVNFPMSLHGLDVWGREVTETGLHIESGDKDGYCRATRGSLSIVPWAKRQRLRRCSCRHSRRRAIRSSPTRARC